MNVELRVYKDPWMDNGLENFFRILKSLDSCNVELTDTSIKLEIKNKEMFTKDLSRKILEKRQNLIIVEKNKKTNETKEVKKDHLILQEEKKIGGKVAFKEDLYKPERAAEIVSRVFGLKDGKARCILCGRAFDKAVKKLQQANYPFATKIASLSGVRSYKDGKALSLKEYYNNLCPLCYLVGILEWTDEALIYRTFPGDKSFLYLPYFSSLKELHDFKRSCIYSGILSNTARYSNIRVNPNADDVENTPGEYSTLLCFYEKFVENSTDEILANEWVVLQIPFGSVKNIKVDFVGINDGILGVINELKESGKLERIYSDSIKKVYFFSETKNSIDWEITREIQENLSKFFLLDDFRGFTSCLLPRKGGYVFFSSEVRQALEELISEWRWKRMGIPKEKLDAVKSVGNIIALISEKKNPALLYKLDKVRNIDEFWSVLREIAKRLTTMEQKDLVDSEGNPKIKPKSLDELVLLVKEVESKKELWKEIRDLLVVYSSMYYMIEKMKKMSKSGGGSK